MWSAAVDPCVLSARCAADSAGSAHAFDGTAEAKRLLRSGAGQHLLVERGGALVRIDVVEGSALAGPCSLCFELPVDHRLHAKVSAVRTFIGSLQVRPSLQLARRLSALEAYDAHLAGMSLRAIADRLLGPGDWPGDGEHRKSLVRRLVASGRNMIEQGPAHVLQN
ncbi:MAG: hypothetical protein BGN95_11560 [Sphingomonas sp. 66-10]|nr:MAG: hypothetical protein BGN95_11560 [Sphingomonas sp. 66-10]